MKLDDYKDLFIEESADLLKKIEAGLLGLEEDNGNFELINEVFRALHTIKGSGAMFGFVEVSEFTHVIENLFDEVRKGKLKIVSSIIEIGLKSIDCINALINGEDAHELKGKIIADINGMDFLANDAGNSANQIKGQADQISELQTSNIPRAWRIVFKPEQGILHRGTRLESLFNELSELGTIHIMAETDNLGDLNSIDPTHIYLSWVISLSTTESQSKIQSVFMFVEDYCELSITKLESNEVDGVVSVPRIGEILVERGHIDIGEVEEIIQSQQTFGEVALKSGKVRQEHIEAALAEQHIVRATNNERETRKETASIRVKKEKLDHLIDLVGELVILQAMLEQEAKKASLTVFNTLSETLGRLSAELRDNTMNIRMVPLEESFNNYQRLIRDLAKQLNKEIHLELSGVSTELDKNVIEELKDPIVHILRNSADHGLETPEEREKAGKSRHGTIRLDAQQVGSRVEISISDDGKGLNLQKIKDRAVEKGLLTVTETDENRIKSIIFEPGFSTAEKTTGVSGRGVGMDVVKSNVERLRGDITVHSKSGEGTKIVISIPLTLVIIEGLQVRVENHDYVILLSQVQECVDMEKSIEVSSGNESLINLRGKTIPIISLRQSLGSHSVYSGISRIVIVSIDGNNFGLMVDEVVGRKQVVIKPLAKTLQKMKIISGATILGDGSVGLIIDTNEVVRKKLSHSGLS